MSDTAPDEVRLELAEDVLWLPAEALPPERRAELPASCQGIVSRRGSRSSPLAVDLAGWRLAELFSQPTSLVDAVVLYCAVYGDEVADRFDAASRWVDELRRAGILRRAGDGRSEDAIAGPQLDWSPWRAEGELRRTVDGSAWLLRDPQGRPAFGKVAHRPASRRLLEREEGALVALAGWGRAPGLLHRCGDRECIGLVLSWIPGLPFREVVRRCTGGERRDALDVSDLLGLCVDLARTLEELHRQGVVHGDLHSGNLLLDRADRWRLVDFGWSGSAADLARLEERGGVPSQWEPELAAALLADRAPPPCTPAAEQHALCALLYELVTGQPPRALPLGRAEALRRLANSPPRRFAEVGAEPWPELEVVLERGLAAVPGDRHADVSTLRRSLESLAAGTPPTRTRAPRPGAGEALRDRLWRALGPGSEAWRRPLPRPTATLHLGAAGIAHLLQVVAAARSAELLDLARLWVDRSLRDLDADEEGALRAPELGITRDRLGSGGLFHGELGIWWVAQRQARLERDVRLQERAEPAVRRCVERIGSDLDDGHDATSVDLFTGAAGALLVAAESRSTMAWSAAHDLAASVLVSPLGAGAVPPGLAHGSAGVALALIEWRLALHGRVDLDGDDDLLSARLERLAAAATPRHRGAVWRLAAPHGGRGPERHAGGGGGWCGGAAGLLRLFSRLTQLEAEGRASSRDADPGWGQLADQAAWPVYDEPVLDGTLCCGLAGRLSALADFVERVEVAPGWRRRLAGLAARFPDPARDPQRFDKAFPHSLMRGWIAACTVAELASEPWLERCALLPGLLPGPPRSRPIE